MFTLPTALQTVMGYLRNTQSHQATLTVAWNLKFLPEFGVVTLFYSYPHDRRWEMNGSIEKKLIWHSICNFFVLGLMNYPHCVWFSWITFELIHTCSTLEMSQVIFYSCLCYMQSIPPEIGLHYSFCGACVMWPQCFWAAALNENISHVN